MVFSLGQLSVPIHPSTYTFNIWVLPKRHVSEQYVRIEKNLRSIGDCSLEKSIIIVRHSNSSHIFHYYKFDDKADGDDHDDDDCNNNDGNDYDNYRRFSIFKYNKIASSFILLILSLVAQQSTLQEVFRKGLI